MDTVRAKFQVRKVETTLRSVRTAEEFVKEPLYTVEMFPVYQDRPGSENTKFWEATPGGTLRLDMVKKDAGEFFELGEEFYIDITKAS